MIQNFHRDFENITRKDKKNSLKGNLYNNGILVPCLFNSGCVIGKRGMTSIEIENGMISLVHWFDKKISDKYFNYNGYMPETVGSSDYHRVVLKRDKIEYVFTRIKLLS